MTGEIHHQIMNKINNQIKISKCHTQYVCDNTSSHQVQVYSHIKFLMLPPNATSIIHPLDQAIILSTKPKWSRNGEYPLSALGNVLQLCTAIWMASCHRILSFLWHDLPCSLVSGSCGCYRFCHSLWDFWGQTRCV